MMKEQELSLKLLRQQNYQLKNQISQLKNAFDLNRDILKILSQQSRQINPDVKVFYQIIRRLTSLNNQTMIAFADMVHQKITLKNQVQKSKNQIAKLHQRLQQTALNMEKKSNPREIQLQLRQQMQICREDLLKMKGQLVLKQQEINRLKKTLQGQNNQFQPVYGYHTTGSTNRPNQKFIKEKSEKLQQAHIKNQQLVKKNNGLRMYAEQLQGRVIILLKALKLEPQRQQQQDNIRQQYRPQADLQLSLLKFALNNMKINQQAQDFRLTMTKRYTNHKRKRDEERPKSCQKI